jgi:hypothetical protein
MNITFTQAEELYERRIRESGLDQFRDRERSQFLDLQDQIFVEIVLNDATRLDDAERIVRNLAREFKDQGIHLDSVVRAVWEIGDVGYLGPSRTSDGGLRAALEFHVTLKSGTRLHGVTVDVSWGAAEFLEQKFSLKSKGTRHGNQVGKEMLAKAVRSFVQHQLTVGGTSYWDPIRFPRLELNDAAMLFLMGQSTAFNELRQAISDAFEPPVAENFVKSLAVSDVRIMSFEAVLPDFSNMLGGAYRRGATVSTNANELFQKLDHSEQELLKNYLHTRVEMLKIEFPELIKSYPKVFR